MGVGRRVAVCRKIKRGVAENWGWVVVVLDGFAWWMAALAHVKALQGGVGRCGFAGRRFGRRPVIALDFPVPNNRWSRAS